MKLPLRSECASCALGRVSQPGPCPFHDQARPAGSVLLAQGERAKAAWYLREGTALLSSVNEGGDETLCALRGPGSVLGLEALHDRPLEYEAWALSDVVVCRLDAAAFRAWVGDRNSPLGAMLDLSLQEGWQRQHERIALSGRAVVRLARFLLERRRMEAGDRPLAVEQQVVARMLGMRAETLSRALAQLRDAGAIAPHGIQVLDAAVLERLAGSGE